MPYKNISKEKLERTIREVFESADEESCGNMCNWPTCTADGCDESRAYLQKLAEDPYTDWEDRTETVSWIEAFKK